MIRQTALQSSQSGGVPGARSLQAVAEAIGEQARTSGDTITGSDRQSEPNNRDDHDWTPPLFPYDWLLTPVAEKGGAHASQLQLHPTPCSIFLIYYLYIHVRFTPSLLSQRRGIPHTRPNDTGVPLVFGFAVLPIENRRKSLVHLLGVSSNGKRINDLCLKPSPAIITHRLAATFVLAFLSPLLLSWGTYAPDGREAPLSTSTHGLPPLAFAISYTATLARGDPSPTSHFFSPTGTSPWPRDIPTL